MTGCNSVCDAVPHPPMTHSHVVHFYATQHHTTHREVEYHISVLNPQCYPSATLVLPWRYIGAHYPSTALVLP